MRQPALVNAHDGAVVHAEDGSTITADGGTIYASQGTGVTAIGHTIIYYKDGAHISARDNTEVYKCAGGGTDFDLSTCQRER
jgi:hypothetical protein